MVLRDHAFEHDSRICSA